VVGGGVSGLSCARTLAQAGLGVRLLEARRVGSGASGRNGGFALRGLALPYAIHRNAALMRLTDEGLERMADLAGDAFHRAGSLYVAADQEELALVRAEHEALSADGFEGEWVEAEALPTALSPHYVGGLFHPHDGLLEPGRWSRRLAELAAATGVEIHEESRALELDGTVVRTAGGSVAADAVVLATDGYTHGLLPELDELVAPARNQVLATVPLDERYFEPAVYARHGYDYWQQTPGGRIVLGGRRDVALETETTREEATTALVQGELEGLLERLLGHVPAVTHRWAGLLGFTPDRLPLVGALPGREGVWCALGYSGHGNVLALVCGEGVAHALLGRPDTRLAAFSPGRTLDARAHA
jgi:gamma-glutamylputrescine oxidase